jgi:hypothetical protein
MRVWAPLQRAFRRAGPHVLSVVERKFSCTIDIVLVTVILSEGSGSQCEARAKSKDPSHRSAMCGVAGISRDLRFDPVPRPSRFSLRGVSPSCRPHQAPAAAAAQESQARQCLEGIGEHTSRPLADDTAGCVTRLCGSGSCPVGTPAISPALQRWVAELWLAYKSRRDG